MPNLHALQDEVVRNRVDLINSLNKLFAEDKEAGIRAFQLSLQQIYLYFKGNPESKEPVKEQANEI